MSNYVENRLKRIGGTKKKKKKKERKYRHNKEKWLLTNPFLVKDQKALFYESGRSRKKPAVTMSKAQFRSILIFAIRQKSETVCTGQIGPTTYLRTVHKLRIVFPFSNGLHLIF